MARPRKAPPSRSSLVPSIVRHAAARGVDVEALAWRFGLPHDVSRSEETTTGADVPDELLRAIARLANEPDVALRVAVELTSRALTLVELAVRASENVGDALERLARWVPLLQEGLRASLDVGEETAESGAREARWTLRAPHHPRGAGRYVHELVLAHAVHQARSGAGDIALTRVWFMDARPPDLSCLRAFFATDDLAFGCEDSGFALARASLKRPMRLAEARTADTLATVVEGELGGRPRGASLAERVAIHLAASLPQGTDVAEVACVLHMSARTLQRRLEQEHTRFTEVLDRARLSLARRLLADPDLPLADIAFRLGFADLATFSRAFKRWTGRPPGQWRRS